MKTTAGKLAFVVQRDWRQPQVITTRRTRRHDCRRRRGRLTVETGAGVAFGSHFSKGNQIQKESIDRISGSGVFARVRQSKKSKFVFRTFLH